MTKIEFFTSESVTEGHPDKICDQISDAILDALLKQDKNARCAVECLTTTGLVIVAGEISTTGYVEVRDVVRNTLKEIGYTNQSPDIAQGVDGRTGREQGAGDQGLMYGFATNETDELMPLPITIAHKLAMRLAYVRKEGILKDLGPDGKSQVSVEYHDGKPVRLSTVVIAQQHIDGTAEEDLRKGIFEHVIRPVCGNFLDDKTKIYINATGKFVIGGPEGDTGLTGRKIIVDTYGGLGRHGGGAFSGKDPSKVDRSGTYAARWIAKNIVAAGLADKCEVQVSYAIGIPEPTSINVDTSGTNKIPEEKIVSLIKKNFNLNPGEIIKRLDLLRPIYKKTAAYGHFGRNDPDFTWEKTDMADTLRMEAGL